MSAPDAAPISYAEYSALMERMERVEAILVNYMVKHRELAIIEMGYVEDALGLERTKEKRK